MLAIEFIFSWKKESQEATKDSSSESFQPYNTVKQNRSNYGLILILNWKLPHVLVVLLLLGVRTLHRNQKFPLAHIKFVSLQILPFFLIGFVFSVSSFIDSNEVKYLTFSKHFTLACPTGFYGEGCKQKCTCVHMEPCHPVTGTCQCDPGFFGAHCSKGRCHSI